MNLDLEQIIAAILPPFIVGLALIAGAFVAVIVFRRLIRGFQFSEDVKARIAKAWKEVEEHTRVADDTHLRMAVIKADGVLDMALRAKAFPGQTMGDRLKFASHKYRNLKKVRWAHSLRNTLAHEPLKALSHNQALGAVNAFRAALRDLGAI